MINIPSDHNQRLGFNRYQKTAPGREEIRQVRSQRIRLQEVRIADAKHQLFETGKIKNVLGVIGGGKEATVLLAEGKPLEQASSDCTASGIQRESGKKPGIKVING